MKKFIVALGIASIAATSLQCSSFAETNDFHRGKHNHHMQKRKEHHKNFAEKLNLTDEQKKQAEALRMQSKSQIEPIFNEMKEAKQKMRELRDSNADEKTLRLQRLKVLELKDQMRKIRKQNFANFEQILTPEQKTQFAEIKQKRKEKREKFKQKRTEKREKFKQKRTEKRHKRFEQQ